MDITYLNGIYQAKTTSLLQDNDVKALEQLNHFEFLDYLKNIGFGSGSKYLTIQDVIASEAKSTRNELNELTGSTLLGDVMFVNNDLNNVKIAYKSNRYNLDTENEDTVSRFPMEALEQYIKYDNANLLNNNDMTLLKVIKEVMQTDIKEELQTIEKAFYNFYIEKINDKFEPLSVYIETINFITNLNTFLKLRSKNVKVDVLKNALLFQRDFQAPDWVELFDKSNEEIIEVISLQYYGKLKEAVIDYFDNNDTDLLHSQTNKVLDEIVQDLSYDHNDIGPIIHYIHLKKQELNNVRRLYYASNK